MGHFGGSEPSKELSIEALVGHTVSLEGEKRLMLAVLEGAVRDFQTYARALTGRGRHIFIEADTWLRARGAGPFTFETICQANELDPDFIRDGLRRWYAEQRTEAAPVRRPHRLLGNHDRDEVEGMEAVCGLA